MDLALYTWVHPVLKSNPRQRAWAREGDFSRPRGLPDALSVKPETGLIDRRHHLAQRPILSE